MVIHQAIPSSTLQGLNRSETFRPQSATSLYTLGCLEIQSAAIRASFPLPAHIAHAQLFAWSADTAIIAGLFTEIMTRPADRVRTLSKSRGPSRVGVKRCSNSHGPGPKVGSGGVRNISSPVWPPRSGPTREQCSNPCKARASFTATMKQRFAMLTIKRLGGACSIITTSPCCRACRTVPYDALRTHSPRPPSGPDCLVWWNLS